MERGRGDLRGDVRWGRTGAYDQRTLAPWVVLLAALLLLGLATVFLAPGPPPPQPAQPFTVRTTGLEAGAGGEAATFSLADRAGQVVVVDLMAVECLPCRDVTRDVLLPLWREHGQRPDFSMVSVDAWSDPAMPGHLPGVETEERLEAVQRESGAPWPHALDTDRVWEKYGHEGLPRLVLVDRDQAVARQWTGVPDAGEVQAAVAAALQ